MSYSVINLPKHLWYGIWTSTRNTSLIHLCCRYRTANLLLAGILPGPKEANYDQVQRYLQVLVNELIRLWCDGVVLRTPKYPEG